MLRSAFAPAPRTLVDILHASATDFPDVAALDNGADVLTYAELVDAAELVAGSLAQLGVGRGDKVGVRITSGTTDLYVAIAAILVAGAAYVPVDMDDPDERARTVFAEAAVAAVITDDLVITPTKPANRAVILEPPTVSDDAWVIFTSGSTGIPKGVAVTHRNAAGFVDAESRLYLQRHPLGVADRVMAGSRSRSTLPARRSGLLGPTAPASSQPRARWFAAARIWAPGWSQRDHRRVNGSHSRCAVADRVPRRRTPPHPRW